MTELAEVAQARLALICAGTNFLKEAGRDEAVNQLAALLISVAGGPDVELKPTRISFEGVNATILFGPKERVEP